MSCDIKGLITRLNHYTPATESLKLSRLVGTVVRFSRVLHVLNECHEYTIGPAISNTQVKKKLVQYSRGSLYLDFRDKYGSLCYLGLKEANIHFNLLCFGCNFDDPHINEFIPWRSQSLCFPLHTCPTIA